MWSQLSQFLSSHQTLLWAIGSAAGFAGVGLVSFTLGRRVGRNEAGDLYRTYQGGHDDTLFPMQTDKRASSRRGGNAVTVLYALEAEPHNRKEAFVADRSMGGLRLVIDDQLEPGTKLVVLPAKAPESTRWVEMEVRNVAKVDGQWEIGCKFLHMPPYATLVLFG
jgi:hypothetical protein